MTYYEKTSIIIIILILFYHSIQFSCRYSKGKPYIRFNGKIRVYCVSI